MIKKINKVNSFKLIIKIFKSNMNINLNTKNKKT